MKQQYKITFSNFNNSSDTTPKEVTETISKFIARFKYPEEKNLTLKEFHKFKPTDVEQKNEKNGACYCFATFGDDSGKEKYRKNSNVSSISGIGIDVDNKDTNEYLTIEDVEEIFKDYFFIVHSTHSSTKKQPRFRVVIPFAKPIVPEKHADVFDYFYQLCDKKIDANTKDVSRLFYYPSCPKGATKNYYCFVNDKKLFDTRIVPASVSVPPKAKKPTKKSAPLDCPKLKEIDLDSLTISEALKDSIIEGYKKGKFKSKSEHAYDCITQLLRDNIQPNTIFCIIANKNYVVNAHYSSDGQVWADIVRIKNKLAEGKKGFAVVVGTEPRYPRLSKYQDPDKICKDIKNDIDTYLNKQKQDCTYSLGIKAPAGIGKTEVVIQKIVELVKERAYIEVYLPSNKLAKEFEKRILKTDSTVSVQLIHGRYSKNAPNNHCIKSKLAQRLASSNVSVLSLLCINEGTQFCKSYDSCNYRGQYTSNKSVVIYNHKHLFIERNAEEKIRKPNLIIIDESFFEQSLNATEIKVDEIDALKVSDTVKGALATKRPYDYLKKHCDNPQLLIKELLKELKSKRDALIKTITPGASERESQNISENVFKFSKSITLLETIKADYVKIKAGKIPLFLYCQEKNDRDSGKKKIVAWHCIKPHSKFERLCWQEDEEESLIPTVYIDADLDNTITSLFFEDLDIKAYVAKRKAKIWQLLSNTHAKRDFYGDGADIKIKLVQKKINYFCNKFKKEGEENVLLVTYKSLLDDKLFDYPNNCRAIHFGGLRGLDDYKDCEACIVIGRQQLPYDAIDRIVIGLWCDSEKELPLQQKNLPAKKELGYRTKNDKQLGIPVYVYEDDRLQAIMEQKRECETLQAIDRLRLIFNDDKKAILILSNVPLDIELDQYVFYKTATDKINRLIKASENNVISLNPKTLYHYSTLCNDEELQFESEESAKKIISRWKKWYLNDDNEALVYGVIMKQTKYSFDNRAGSPSYCLHKNNATDHEVIESLKIIHNTDTVTLKN